MSISPVTIEKRSEKYILVMDGSQTLDSALRRFLQSDYPPNDAWLVVAQYQVAPLAELQRLQREGGRDSAGRQLSSLGLPPASRVVPIDTEEDAAEILDWIDAHLGKTLVVTDAKGLAGLFTNVHMAGGAEESFGLTSLPADNHCKRCTYDQIPDKSKIETPLYTCPQCRSVYTVT